jgi:hypothetical protein
LPEALDSWEVRGRHIVNGNEQGHRPSSPS